MGALGLLAAIPAHALGLGKIELSSALNEPFKAEISVNAVSGDEAESLQVRLASNDEFERAGLVKNAAVIQLKFQVTEKAGKTVIVVSSKNPVKEPLLDFLLLAKTSSGQLIREYTVLLDPPKYVFKDSRRAANVVSSPSISQPRQVISQSRPAPVKNNQQSSTPSLAGSERYGKTSRTDTLWDIALKTRPSRDISVHQMMLALVKENERAFIKQNINGLKSGYTLTIPSENDITRLNKQQAVAAVKQQNVDWINRNNPQRTASVAFADTKIDNLSSDLSEVDVEETLHNVVVPEGEGESVARLQLLGSNDDKPLSENDLAAFGNEKVKELSDQLTIAQEVIESQQQENIDIKSRMAAMEEQIQTLRKLIALQDSDLAKLQSKLERDAAEAEAALETLSAGDLAESTKSEIKDDVEQVDDETANILEVDSTVDTVAKVEDKASEIAEADITEEVVETAVQDEPEVMTWFEKVQAFLVEYKLQALVGVLGLLLGLFFMGRKREEEEEKVPWNESVDNIRASQPTPAPVAVAVPAAMVVEEIESEPEPVKTVDDIIKDADDYVGDGDFEKAGIALEEAHRDEPANLAVIQKLLFTHYKQGKTDDFAALASQYEVDRDSMEWAEVAEWGKTLDASNVLFAEPIIEEPVVDLADLEAGLTFDTDDNDSDVTETLEEADVETENDLLDFDAELSEPAETPENMEITSDELEDINIDITSDDAGLVLSPSSDDSLELDGLAAITNNDLEAATQALTDDNELTFDLSDFDHVDEAETKLDLASAYIEMGDPDGAKSILEEIMAEGNEEQQSRSKTLLNDLS